MYVCMTDEGDLLDVALVVTGNSAIYCRLYIRSDTAHPVVAAAVTSVFAAAAAAAVHARLPVVVRRSTSCLNGTLSCLDNS